MACVHRGADTLHLYSNCLLSCFPADSLEICNETAAALCLLVCRPTFLPGFQAVSGANLPRRHWRRHRSYRSSLAVPKDSKHSPMRTIKFLAAIAITVLPLELLLNASAPQVPPHTWAVTAEMAVGRADASSVLLRDGRVLVTGGT